MARGFTQQGLPDAYRQAADEVLAALGSDAGRGLGTDEVRSRLDRWGRNELDAEAPTLAWRKFLAQFTDVLVILLIAAALISAGLWFVRARTRPCPTKRWPSWRIVLLNAAMGYFQQARAEQALAALRRMSAAHANVVRDGEGRASPRQGSCRATSSSSRKATRFPADARLIQSTALQTSEAALTGESLPVSKDTAHRGGGGARRPPQHGLQRHGGDLRARPRRGHGDRYVDRDGAHRRHAEEAPDETTPLQKELDRVGRLLGIVVVASRR